MALPLPGGPDPDPIRQQKFERLAQAMIGTGSQSMEIRGGTATVTYPGGSPNTGTLGVNHGLGRVPVAVVATTQNSGPARFTLLAVTALTATSFSVQGQINDLSSPAAQDVGFSWFAIG